MIDSDAAEALAKGETIPLTMAYEACDPETYRGRIISGSIAGRDIDPKGIETLISREQAVLRSDANGTHWWVSAK